MTSQTHCDGGGHACKQRARTAIRNMEHVCDATLSVAPWRRPLGIRAHGNEASPLQTEAAKRRRRSDARREGADAPGRAEGGGDAILSLPTARRASGDCQRKERGQTRRLSLSQSVPRRSMRRGPHGDAACRCCRSEVRIRGCHGNPARWAFVNGRAADNATFSTTAVSPLGHIGFASSLALLHLLHLLLLLLFVF